MDTEQQNDLLIIEDPFVRASAGKRFLNYIIDLIGFTIFLVMIGIILSTVTSTFDELADSGSFGLLATIIYALYMSLLEFALKGKSLGKILTGTRAINLNGSNISIGTALGRGFTRVVPFCAFSALGNPCNPWQDRWTNTMVIANKNLKYLNPEF